MDGEKAEGMTVDERAKTRKEKALIECIGRVLSAQLKEKTELVQKISEILCRKVSGENVSEELSGYMRKYARLTFKADILSRQKPTSRQKPPSFYGTQKCVSVRPLRLTNLQKKWD